MEDSMLTGFLLLTSVGLLPLVVKIISDILAHVEKGAAAGARKHA